MQLSRFPRLQFAHLPTPLEPLAGLTKALGGPRIWIKRDDCTGLAGGGNKTRKLEFLLADAIERGADTVVTQGATQSNHVRQTAAAAARLGLGVHILLEDRTGYDDVEYNYNGNVLLNQLFGARLEKVPAGTDMQAAMGRCATGLAAAGRRPYIIPGGGSNPVGALGYVNAALEILTQCNDRGLRIDEVVHATGSAGTQAGLVTGLAGSRSGIPVLGIGVRAPRDAQQASVHELAVATAELLGIGGAVNAGDVVANCDYVGEGYGLPTDAMREAVQLVARADGILLDPVYSGKGMAGLIDLVRGGRYSKDQNVLFVHTGGAQALFGYRECFGYGRYDQA